MQGRFGCAWMTATLFLASCATSGTNTGAAHLSAVSMPAAAETAAVATARADAADDPAIWARADGARFAFGGTEVDGIILGTDKKAGLYVFGLDGRSLQFLPEGLLNNVDLRSEGEGFLAGASDRGRMGIALYRFIPGVNKVVPAGFIPSDVVEPYGFCMGRLDGALVTVLVAKDGQVRIYRLAARDGAWTGSELRRFSVPSQAEGCVVDDDTATLYLGEEAAGIWRVPLDPARNDKAMFARVGDGQLVADVEGMSILRDGADRFLIVSSQGDSAFAVWRLGEVPTYVGRFRIAPAGAVDGVSGTDGIDAWSGPIGAYRHGLIVAQDDDNPGAGQNFKLVDWAAIRDALDS